MFVSLLELLGIFYGAVRVLSANTIKTTIIRQIHIAMNNSKKKKKNDLPQHLLTETAPGVDDRRNCVRHKNRHGQKFKKALVVVVNDIDRMYYYERFPLKTKTKSSSTIIIRYDESLRIKRH